MARWKMIAETFLDGFSPLDALIERPVRPGSTENLIQGNHPHPYILHFQQDLKGWIRMLREVRTEINKEAFRAAAEEMKQAMSPPNPRKAMERHGGA